jgi:molybdate transport repressor ModE-like protein
MGMAYCKASRLIETMEKRLAFLLMERKVWGPSGGGVRVTPRGKELMKRYRRFQKNVNPSLEKNYRAPGAGRGQVWSILCANELFPNPSIANQD